jgi:hypothetical protein
LIARGAWPVSLIVDALIPVANLLPVSLIPVVHLEKTGNEPDPELESEATNLVESVPLKGLCRDIFFTKAYHFKRYERRYNLVARTKSTVKLLTFMKLPISKDWPFKLALTLASETYNKNSKAPN